MANHKSSIKRIRSDEAKKLRNKYQHKSTRTLIKKFQQETKKAAAKKLLPKAVSMIDKLVKNNIIHKNIFGGPKIYLIVIFAKCIGI